MSKEKRSKTMSAIRSQSKLENRLSKALWRKGYRFRKNVRGLYGTPDIVIKKYKVVIFIDSCFWHVCPIHGNKPKSNQEFWNKKLLRNQERDIEVSKYYKEHGWNIMRIWEHEVNNDIDRIVKEISDFIERAKQEY